MKKTFCTLAPLFLAILALAGVFIAVSRDHPKCSVNSLVLGEEEMPKGWKKQWSAVPPVLNGLGAQQAYEVFMQNSDKTAHHTVYQYSNRWLAVFHIWFDNEVFFPSVGWNWSELREANGLPLHADQRQIRCGNSNDPHLSDRCTAILRYGPYISDFSSSIQEGIMSTEEFNLIVLKIDELFNSCEE